MHERSLVKALLRQVTRIAAAEGGGDIAEIHVAAGTLSGVEPLLFESAFTELAAETIDTPCRLILDIVPVTAICQQCDHEFEVVDFVFHCPCCGGDSVRVVRGDEVQLVSVTLRSDHPQPGVAP